MSLRVAYCHCHEIRGAGTEGDTVQVLYPLTMLLSRKGDRHNLLPTDPYTISVKDHPRVVCLREPYCLSFADL